MKKPLKIGYTFGDLGGVGPEIFAKFYKANKDRNDIEIKLVDSELGFDKTKVVFGKASAYSGEHSYKTLVKADQMIKAGELDYLVTGPVAKESLWLAGIQCSGQTELLAHINGLSREEIEMFFILDNFRIVLATRHIPIVDVPKVLEERLEYVLKNSINALENVFKINNPKIAVAGLNPHAGENGIIGLEENKFMKSCIRKFQNEANITGPFSADTLFARAAQEFIYSSSEFRAQGSVYLSEPPALSPKLSYDLYVAAYHDQALSLIKGLGGLRAINLTFGLPYTRLSVDHGTGFDIAGQNIASYQGLEACTDYANKLVTV